MNEPLDTDQFNALMLKPYEDWTKEDSQALEYRRIGLETSIALMNRVASFILLYHFNEETYLEAKELANSLDPPFDLDSAIMRVDQYLFVNRLHLPGNLLVPIILIPKHYVINDNFVPLMFVASAMSPEHRGLITTAPKTDPLNNGAKTYIMHDRNTGMIKIGKSKAPKVREGTLQSQAPKIKLIHVYDLNIESRLHKHFAHKRVRGEWFDVTVEEAHKVAIDLMRQFS